MSAAPAAYQRYLSAAEDRHAESHSSWETRRRHADERSSWEPRHDARGDDPGRRMPALAPRDDPQTPPRAQARQQPRIGPEKTPPRAAVANEAPGNLGRLGLLMSEVDEARVARWTLNKRLGASGMNLLTRSSDC